MAYSPKSDRRYKQTAIKNLVVALNIRTDADIIEHLNELTNESKQGYVKRLIREDMECHAKEEPRE